MPYFSNCLRSVTLLLVSMAVAAQAQTDSGNSTGAGIFQGAGQPLTISTPAISGGSAPLTPVAGSGLNQTPTVTKLGGDSPVTDATARPTAAAATAAPKPAPKPNQFQRFVQEATGRLLPVYGRELFETPQAYVPDAAMPAHGEYVLGPGDEVRLQVWGAVDYSGSHTIDRNGQVTLPKVGAITLAGVQVRDLESVLQRQLGKVFTHFSLNANLGRLRGIQVYVVGQAQQPGTIALSSLGTLVNALFVSGGPSANGSMRNIQLKRGDKTITTIDLYDFIARGNKSRDLPLLSGDVIVIPPVGASVAITGAFDHAAIYEIKPGETIADILALTGGLPALAAPQRAQLERVRANEQVARYVQDFALDKAGLARPLQSGDVLTLFQISAQIANVVTLEGNVAAPMRYSFRSGMRVSDLLTDPRLLIPGSYWQQLNQGASTDNYSRPEVNLDYATIQRLDGTNLRTKVLAFNLLKAVRKDPQEDLLLMSGDIVTVYKPGQAGPVTEDSISISGEIVGGTQRFVWRPGFTIRDIIPSAQWLVDYYNYWQRGSANSLRNDINWDYAQVIRRVPATLETRAITFNLGAAVLRGQPENNLALQPGDQISLFTTQQMAVPIEKRTRLVTLKGEMAVPGVYQVGPTETLAQIIERAGGFTNQAYVYGLEFTRDSVRSNQQANLDRIVQRVEKQINTETQTRLQNISTPEQAITVRAGVEADQARISNLRKLRASGRVALGLDPVAPQLPRLTLEDGDTVYVPATPAFIGAFGSVLNENAMLWKAGTRVQDAVRQAGLATFAEESEVYVMRADGSVQGGRDSGSFFGLSSGINSLLLMPGDTLIVPEKANRETAYTAFIRGAKDWTAILAQFGLGAAAIKTLSN